MQTLRFGSQGSEVQKLQQYLTALGEPIAVTGVFDQTTSLAVQRYQQIHNLNVTGEVDLLTLRSIRSQLELRQYGPVQDKQPQRLIMIAPIDAFSGYGQQAISYVQEMLDYGCDVKIRSRLDERVPVPEQVKKCMVQDQPYVDDWEFVMWPPDHQVTPGRKTIYFTMWETTRLKPYMVKILNQAKCVIVPCEWNMSTFSASGVDTPMRVCNLGIPTEVFRSYPMDTQGPCVFGAAGRLADGGERKRLDVVIDCFQRAFPTEPDVRLRIKCFDDELRQLPELRDRRIEYYSQWMNNDDLAKWYAGLTAFVSASTGEGFGLMNLQAMAVGRPLICAKFGGVTEYFDEHVGYAVHHTYELARGKIYKDSGHWCKVDSDHMVDRMKFVYEHRNDAQKRGVLSSIRASRYTSKSSGARLLRILKEFGMIR